jgi:hypothetical protein
MSLYHENTKWMEKVHKSVESYKRETVLDILAEISSDYQIDLDELIAKYASTEAKPLPRCMATNRKSFRRCIYCVIPGTNFCKRHQFLSLPVNENNKVVDRECPYRHNHPPFQVDVPGCKKCEYDAKQNLREIL